MQSTLIRFTDKKYVDSYLKGDLYLSSLSRFWDFTEGKIPFGKKLSKEEMANLINGIPDDRQDFSEGIIAQIPRDKISSVFGSMGEYIIHDVRFRLSAYKYCNLLCFFRIDAEDADRGFLDEENTAYLLSSKGKTITEENLRTMEPAQVRHLVDSILEPNPLLSPNKIHAVQLPRITMNNFGDVVIVVKDEREFERRIIAAVKRLGGHAILGDVRYHPMADRVEPNTMNRHSITVVSSDGQEDSDTRMGFTMDGTFHLSVLDGIEGIYWRGALDKYNKFAHQKEWRRNYAPKILPVGSLEDIIDIVETKDIRPYLLKKYKGYFPGIVNSTRKQICGTESYHDFKEYIKTIDGLGDFVMEIG